MKTILLTLTLFLLGFTVLGQNDDKAFPEVFEFIYVDSVPEVQKAELYKRARTWVATNFASANHVIQMEDKDEGRIICKGNMDISTKVKAFVGGIHKVEFTMTIDVKDYKFRMVINNMICDYGSLSSERPFMKSYSKKEWTRVRTETRERVYDEFDTFGNALKNGNVTIINDGY